MLDAYNFVDTISLNDFLETTRTKYGGYGKVPEAYPGQSWFFISSFSFCLQHGLLISVMSRLVTFVYGTFGVSVAG